MTRASGESGLRVQLDPGGRVRMPRGALLRAVEATCRSESVKDAEISVALLDDAGMDALSRAHLNKPGTTDVLAFALYDPGEPVLGDIYVGVDQAARQAAEVGVSLREELVRLVVHGTLHVLGLDHPDEAEARERSPMYARQEALVREVLRTSRQAR